MEQKSLFDNSLLTDFIVNDANYVEPNEDESNLPDIAELEPVNGCCCAAARLKGDTRYMKTDEIT